MRPRIKSVNTVNGVQPIQSKTIKGLFTVHNVKAVRVTTSGTREQIEAKFASRVRRSQQASEKHMEELRKLVHETGRTTKYFAA